jgi:hypothetical protein
MRSFTGTLLGYIAARFGVTLLGYIAARFGVTLLGYIAARFGVTLLGYIAARFGVMNFFRVEWLGTSQLGVEMFIRTIFKEF